MDQLKEQLAVVVKYGFWIGSVIVLLVSTGIWWMSTSQLAEESAEQTSRIKSAIQTVSSIQMELPEHPNELSHTEMAQLIEARQDEVLQSWETLFNRQKDILVWPVEALREDFVREYRGKVPIEVHVEHPTLEGDELETSLRSRYERYIKNALPEIAEAGGAKWKAPFEAVAAMGGMGPMASPRMGETTSITGETGGPLVQWATSSQASLLSDLFPWRNKALPTTLEIYYSQENLWVLRQLMEIVADVNGAAKQPYQAKIREIMRLGIGKSVNFDAGNIAKPGSSYASGGMGGMGMGDMMMDDMMGMDGMGMDDMMMGSGTDVEGPDPAENRYVNEALEPIPGADLRTALESNQPSDVALAIAKRVPVVMSLKMDQRAVPELLAACGTAKLMVEVKQTRILPKDTAVGGGSMGGMGGGMEDMGMGGMDEMGMGGMDEMGMGGMGGMGMGGMGSFQDKPVDEFPLDMLVEVYGLIYIYNPPDRAKLGMEQVNTETVDEVVQTINGENKSSTTAPAASGTNVPGTTTQPAADPGATLPADPNAPVNPPAGSGPPITVIPPGQNTPQRLAGTTTTLPALISTR